MSLVAILRAIPRDADGYAVGGTTSGTRRARLREYLHTHSGGLCVVCGLQCSLTAPKNSPESAEAGHLVPGGKDRTGYYPGNLATMCRTCNEDLGNRDATGLLKTFARPDLIPTVWPAWTEIESRYAPPDVSAERNRRRAARKAHGADW